MLLRHRKNFKTCKIGQKTIQNPKIHFARLGCICDFVDRAEALETFLLRVPDVLQDELPCCGAHLLFSLKIHTLRIFGPVPFFEQSRFDQTAYLPTVAPSPARLVLVVSWYEKFCSQEAICCSVSVAPFVADFARREPLAPGPRMSNLVCSSLSIVPHRPAPAARFGSCPSKTFGFGGL